MSLNQLKTIDVLKTIQYNNFIITLMEAYDFPKATITGIKNRSNRNLAADFINEDAIKSKFWSIDMGNNNTHTESIEFLFNNRQIIKNKIRYLIAYNTESIAIKDIKLDETLNVSYDELHLNYGFLLFLAGIDTAKEYGDHPADAKAAIKMGKLFDYITSVNKINNPDDEHLVGTFLTRVLFCFFAENTGIYQKKQFTKAIELYTKKDGSDLDEFLYNLFDVLNTKEDSKKRNAFPQHLQDFPYVNGELFGIDEAIPAFNEKIRNIIVDCGKLDWSKINPDIFGSMFQSITNPEQRSNLGQYYTSYNNIMKTISPLFLDELKENVSNSNTVEKLTSLLKRLRNIKVFDPACGSGNFLITAYKELRALEIAIIKKGIALNENFELNVVENKEIPLNHFYGIEINDFATEIAKLSLLLAKHQMDSIWKEEFGNSNPTLPLPKGANVTCANALRVDWNEICPNDGNEEIYLIGNPPFLGAKFRTKEQKIDMTNVFNEFIKIGRLDFVACWFWKGVEYIKDTKAELAFVSTSSICQGEQVGTLWEPILKLGIHIKFAYTSFAWSNSAKDKANVIVAVISLVAKKEGYQKKLYIQEGNSWSVKNVSNISPYLIEGPNRIVKPITKPISSNALKMLRGNNPTDGGHLFLNNREEYEKFIEKCPEGKKYIRRVLGSEEFINSKERWCFWFADANLEELQQIPEINTLLQKVKEKREKSPSKQVKLLTSVPHLFVTNINICKGEYLVIPIVSSERRKYVPIGFDDFNVIVTNAIAIIPNATMFEYAILTSLIHNEWVKLVGAKFGTGVCYSSRVVYNTFPFPKSTHEQRKVIEALAEDVYFMRYNYPDKSLADLYDPDLMPNELVEAHDRLDKAVEELYKEGGFKDKEERLSHLLSLYEELTKG